MTTIGSGPAGGGLQDILALRRQITEQSETLRDLNNTAPQSPGTVETGKPDGSFADTLRSSIDQVNSAQARSSAITEAYERGEVTDIAQVMMARQESSVAFEATLQVRNKLLSAYQEIMRMGV